MSLLDSLKTFLTLEPQQPLQTRATLATSFDDYPDLATQLVNLRRGTHGPWRTASVQDALGVPTIFGAVNLIANLTGSMSMKAYRGEVELPPEERPRLIVRPDPFTIPREFFRSTAYNLASRGEAWWWAASRDPRDNSVLSVLNIPPAEVTVEENPRDLRYPIIKWRDRVMPNEDFRQLVYSREPGSLRGVGPLQMCGAAVSVAVESQLWAANFFAGGNSAIWVKTTIPLSGNVDDPEAEDSTSEVQRFLDQWMAKDSNTPRVTDDTVEDIKELNLNPQGAQMLEARTYQNAEVAVMFNIPGVILDVAVSGQSLTYQNIHSEFENLLRRCLRPNYLEVMEQTMSDFLSRSTVARFNTDALTLADVKTRYDVYSLGITAGILDAEEARRFEGLAPGDVENARVPAAPPAAIPPASALEMRSEVRCEAVVPKRRSGVMRMATCGKLLSTDGTRPSFCPRCKSQQVAVA